MSQLNKGPSVFVICSEINFNKSSYFSVKLKRNKFGL